MPTTTKPPLPSSPQSSPSSNPKPKPKPNISTNSKTLSQHHSTPYGGISNHQLHQEFWLSLLTLRNYLVRDDRFVNLVFSRPSQCDALRRALMVVDHYVDQALRDLE